MMAEHKIRQAIKRAAAGVFAGKRSGNLEYMTPLESRTMMSASVLHQQATDADIEGVDQWGEWHASPAPNKKDIVDLAVGSANSGSGSTGGGGSTTSLATGAAVPVLNSNPTATAKLYLDFNGDTTATWGSFAPGTTPAYDYDGNPSSFSDAELSSITEIWARVSEKYSPFNINVTTVDPGTYLDKVTERVVIGGTGAWTGATYGGLTYAGGFTSGSSNTAYVFSSNLGGNPFSVAEAASHESGHGFGLSHQMLYDANGTLLQSYYYGTAQSAPVMGVSYNSARGLWWKGTSGSATSIQDDMSILSNTNNGFGYRADDYGNSTSAATGVLASGGSFSIGGRIEKMTDADYFSFTTTGGTLDLTAAVAQFGPTLDLKLELRSSTGTLIASSDTSSLGETLSSMLSAGTYYISVASHGSYGDVGSYTLGGTLTSSVVTVTAPAVPTNLTASISNSQVTLNWTDNSDNESGFTLQRSTDGGSTWTSLNLGANVTTYQESLAQGVTASYRVSAYNSMFTSANSNTASVNNPVPETVPTAPLNLAASLSNLTVTLSWAAGSSNTTGYRVLRSVDGGATTVAYEVSSNTTGYHEDLTAGVTATYSVLALNSAGTSAASNSATVTTAPVVTIPQVPQPPDAPTNFVATANVAGQVDLSWTPVSGATSYWIDRSADGVSGWSMVVTMIASTQFQTTFSDMGVADGTTYYYEMFAINAAGVSSASAMISATTQVPVVPPPPVTPPPPLTPPPALDLPAAPTNLTARSPSRWRIALNWTDNASNESSYVVERSIDGTNWSTLATLPANSNTYTGTRQTRGQLYFFRVCAVNASGTSAYSNVASTAELHLSLLHI
jgi:hypothetical protein